MMLWRQGDILIESVQSLPDGAQKQGGSTLASGELTGHSHRMEVPDAAVIWEHAGTMYLQVLADAATIVHDEHKAITLPRGTYRFWQQREYTPQRIRRIVD